MEKTDWYPHLFVGDAGSVVAVGGVFATGGIQSGCFAAGDVKLHPAALRRKDHTGRPGRTVSHVRKILVPLFQTAFWTKFQTVFDAFTDATGKTYAGDKLLFGAGSGTWCRISKRQLFYPYF